MKLLVLVFVCSITLSKNRLSGWLDTVSGDDYIDVTDNTDGTVTAFWKVSPYMFISHKLSQKVNCEYL
jgi:hypothetical protein